ncbi:hypothetical protein N7520_001153 [Penicillium odoratum]|uniref:uncharacterized protein n=1 Tax=Penicillium odoratum TaxID=1167516 RepID=UPI00254825B0|nr:uncharacterized protein N7520_001153 [Penicillium odoratum]KAJ5777907.1 hypothetical protein N7520_001153 [Penicillium odoratum]
MSSAHFFCARPDGGLTPMIPLDELPVDLSVRGIPRTITAAETQGMTSCGVATARSEPWVVDGATPTALNEDLSQLKSALIKFISDGNIPAGARSIVQNFLTRHLDAVPMGQVVSSTSTQDAPAYANAHDSMATLPAANSAIVQQNAASAGDERRSIHRKKYCSYWIRHGECDYQQQGCLYKHEMPVEPRLIEELGLRDIPRWYREKHNVPSMLHPTYRAPIAADMAQLAIGGTPNRRAIEYTEAMTPSERPASSDNAHHRVGNNRNKARAAQNAKSRVNGRNGNGNRNAPNGVSVMNNATHNITPENSNSSGSPVDNVSSKSNGSRAPLAVQADVINPVSTASQALQPLIANEPSTPFGSAPLGMHSYPVTHLLDNDAVTQSSIFPAHFPVRSPQNHVEDGLNFANSSAPPFRPSGMIPRRPSRRLFDFGNDGDSKRHLSPKSGSPIENAKIQERKPVPILSTMGILLRRLRDESDPIHPHQVLFNFGAIGEDLIMPPMIQCPKTGILIDPEVDEIVPSQASPAMYMPLFRGMYEGAK